MTRSALLLLLAAAVGLAIYAGLTFLGDPESSDGPSGNGDDGGRPRVGPAGGAEEGGEKRSLRDMILELSMNPDGTYMVPVDDFVGMLRIEDELRGLMRNVLLEENPDFQALFLVALSGCEDEGARKLVVEIARGAHGEELRPAALLALSMAPERTEVPVLAETVMGHADRAVFSAALQALVYRGTVREDPGALRSILDALESNLPDERRFAVYHAISGHPMPGGLGEGKVMAKMREEVAAPLAPVPGQEETYRRILEAGVAEKDPRARMAAGSALIRMGTPESADAFVEIWEGSDREVRDMLLGHVDPARSTAEFSLIVDRAAGLGEAGDRRRIARMAAESTDPDLLPKIVDWLQRESDEETLERLRAAKKSLEERGEG